MKGHPVMVLTLVLMSVVATCLADEAPPACTTTIVVSTCDRTPAAGVAVKVTRDGGPTLKGATDAGGRAEFAVCVEDITRVRVGDLRSDRTSFGTVVEEHEGRRLATISVALCEP